MTPILYGLGRFCSRHHKAVIAAWVVIIVGLAGGSQLAGIKTLNNLTLPGTGSQQATDMLDSRWPQVANGSVPIVLGAPSGKQVTDPQYSSAIEQTVANYKKDSAVQSVVSYNPSVSSTAQLLGKGGTVEVISVTLKDSPSQLEESEGNRLVALSSPATKAGLQVGAGGYLGSTVSNPSVDASVAIGIIAAIIIMLFTFGTFIAMGLPMVTALGGLIAGISSVYLLGHLVAVPTVGPSLAMMIALGVGVDYALFMVTRFRQQLATGLDPEEAAARATATAGGAVVFAGVTVVLALLCLAVVKVSLLSAMGYSAALAVVLSILAALTLMPALLSLAGRRIDRLALPFIKAEQKEDPAHPNLWRRWAQMIVRHRIISLIASLLVLAVLIVPARGLWLGQQDNGSFPTNTQARIAYDLLDAGFGPGANATLLVAVAINSTNQSEVQSQLTTLQSDLGKASGVVAASAPLIDPYKNAATINVTPTTSPNEQATSELVTNLRESTIPKATKDSNLVAYVGGTTASYVDLATTISDRLLLTIAVVVLLGFLLMMAAFRSVILAFISSLITLITVAASFGVTTAVFEKGYGMSLIGLEGTVPVVSYVPLMMFAVLFGLSMDYNVFLMSYVRERWIEKKAAEAAIVDGVVATGRTITAAALIMICVFAAFIVNGNPIIKQFGVGTAVAVLIYASLVRCVLVPATMSLLGKAGWYMPRWLDRLLPNFSIEGDSYFAERDAAAGRAANS